MGDKEIIKNVIQEGLNLPKKKKPLFDVVITKISEVIDNWGTTQIITDPEEIKEIIKDSTSWSDDQIFYGLGEERFSWDDLIGKRVMVNLDPLYEIILVTEELNEGLNLQKKTKLDDIIKTTLKNAGYNVVGINISHPDPDSSNFDISMKINTLVGPITLGLEYVVYSGVFHLRFNNPFTFSIKGTNENEIIKSAMGFEKKCKLVRPTITHIINLLKRVLLDVKIS
jgi:hypothetical protein